MSELKIWGGEPLSGRIAVSGAKNGILPLLFASVVAERTCVFYHVPDIGDVRLAVELLRGMGATIEWMDRGVLSVNTASLDPARLRGDMTARLRASSYLLGACLGRFGFAPALETGGCDFGARPLNCHYDFFHAVGAVGERELVTPHGIHAVTHVFPQVSVGATVNALLTASRIPAETTLVGCATEGHIGDLARFLTVMGAEVDGIGTSMLRIRGTRTPRGGSYIVSSDDIEAGTYLFATAACGGDITLTDISPAALHSTLAVLERMGCEIRTDATSVRLIRRGELYPVSVTTAPAPGFPTDLHPPLTAVLLRATGEGSVCERVWGARFRYAEELRRMGASFVIDGDTIRTQPSHLNAARVSATDLRGGAALVIAALTARGRTTIAACEMIERGYEDIVSKLRGIGAAAM